MLKKRTILCLMLLGIGAIAFGETVPPLPARYTQTHLVSSTLWTKNLERFQNLLTTNSDAARTELEHVAKNLFAGHLLAEEWVPLYFRISRDGTEHLSDVLRVSELEIRMFTSLNAKKHAKQIRQHQAALRRYTQNINSDAAEKQQVAPQNLQAAKKTRAEKIDKHVAAYEKLLPTDPDAAHAELVKYAKVTFGEHDLRDEWIALYFRLTREKESTVSEMVQVLTLAKQMLEDNFPDIAAEAIEKIESPLKVFKSLSELQGNRLEKTPFQFSLSAFK